MDVETVSEVDAKAVAKILVLTSAAAAMRDILRLSWEGDTISSAEVQAIADEYGLLEIRLANDDEIAAGVASEGEVVAEFEPTFSEIVDNLDAADAAAEKESEVAQ